MNKWSRDWTNVDWGEIEKRLQNVPEEIIGSRVKFGEYIGMRYEEFLEYLEWISQNDPIFFAEIIMGLEE